MSREVKSVETENGMQMGMGLTVNEHEGSSWGDENFLRPHYGDGCTTRETY